MNIFAKVWNFLKKLVTRPGLDQFLGAYIQLATQIVQQLALVNNNQEFHAWKDQAFAAVKAQTGQLKDNWVAILIHLAYENLKAKGGSKS